MQTETRKQDTPATTVAEFMRSYRGTIKGRPDHCPKAQIGDLKLSIQASETHYCSPRDNAGPWLCVEVGFPNEVVEELLPYAQDADTPTDTVYGWVPIEILDKLIEENGGVIAPETGGR